MESPLLTVKEAAEHLKLSERSVVRMAQRGEIPSTKLGRQWRFRREELDDWMSGRAISSAETESQKLPPEATGVPEPMNVADAINTDRIKLNLCAAGREGILRELVGLVVPPHDTARSETLLKALKAREDLCSTCVDDGVAIPHSRNALVGLVDTAVLAYGRHRTGIEFGAIDGKPVHHFFLLCAPNVREHLRLLARLARLVRQPRLRAALMAAEKSEDIMALIRDAEKKLG